MECANTFGSRLVSARDRTGYTQKLLAEKLGISPTALNYWEKDKREPKIDMIRKIALILDVDPNYLVGCSTAEQADDSHSPPSQQPPDDGDTEVLAAQTSAEIQLLSNYRALNEEGQQKLSAYADDLTQMDKYIKNNHSNVVAREA